MQPLKTHVQNMFIAHRIISSDHTVTPHHTATKTVNVISKSAIYVIKVALAADLEPCSSAACTCIRCVCHVFHGRCNRVHPPNAAHDKASHDTALHDTACMTQHGMTKHDMTQVHPWTIWVYWIDPLQYAQRALIINEFTDSRWGSGPGSLGDTLLTIRSFPGHYW